MSNTLAGNFGLTTNDQIKVLEANDKKLTKGQRVWCVTYRGYSEALDKVTDRSTLETHDKSKAEKQFMDRQSNPHYTHVSLQSWIH